MNSQSLPDAGQTAAEASTPIQKPIQKQQMKGNRPLRALRSLPLAAIFSFVALFSGRVNAQNILAAGGFELGLTAGPGTFVNQPPYGAWYSAYANTAYLLGMPFGSVPAYEGQEAMDVSVDGFGTPGLIWQTFTTKPGAKYKVSLAINGWNGQVGKVRVFVRDAISTTNLVADFISPGSYQWSTTNYTFFATASLSQVFIANISGGFIEAIIDDVRVTEQNLLADGGFELGLTSGPGGYAGGTTFGAWSGLGSTNNLFLFGMPHNPVPPYEGREAMYIGDAGLGGFVSQTFSTVIGQEYWVSFALNGIAGGADTARLTVFSPGKTNLAQNVVSPGSAVWGVASYPFFASNSVTTVKIQNLSGYSIIDDVRVTTTPLDMALKFDGANDYVSLGSGINLSNKSFTVEFWAQRGDASTSDQWVVSQGSSGVNNKTLLIGFHQNKVRFDFFNNFFETDFPYTDLAWHHWAFTHNATSGSQRIYRDGVQVGASFALVNYQGLGPLYLGRRFDGAYFHGQLDEVRIWNSVRTVAQVRDNLNSQLLGNETGLVVYHRMDEGSGLSLVDATANGNNGTLLNGTLRIASTVPECGLATEYASPLGTFHFEGYQAAGVYFPTVGYSNMVVSNLCFNITPGAGTPGVEISNLFVGMNLTLNYAGGIWTNLTSGNNAPGIRVRSLGVNGTSGTPGDPLSDIDGGNGGGGANGGASTVNSTGAIVTSGAGSPGILAISQGGNGGNGGNGWNGGITDSDGGNAGAGGNARAVTITGTGFITTTGSNSIGVYALSQAGQGGNGGAAHGFGTGGSGGIGGDGGTATVDGSWTIRTLGGNAYGLSARSLGGAGGTAASGGWISGSGGAGGGSGDGSNATVNLGPGGTIETSGKDAHGIFAQSIGGFAGSGGSGDSIFSASGGSGGSAGSGGNVNVTNLGVIITRGAGANALMAHSVGGGGGSGGSGSGLFDGGSGSSSAGGNGGQVTVNNQGQLTTTNIFADGIFAQSVGGTGGNGVKDKGLFYSVGGKGGTGGKAGNVTVTNNGQIATSGNDSSGIFAHSVGGGGGTGGGSGTVGAWGSVAVGGQGGGGGGGALVTVNSGTLGSITTQGDRSHGIFAQSVGGGGGNAGYAVAGSLGEGFSVSAGIGGTGGGGGNGSNVLVNSQSAITTKGTNSHGIFAQSVGGGGGSGGYSINVSGSDGVAGSLSVGGTGGGGGSGESVTVNSSGAVQTEGFTSYGILAQSVGGGGGAGGFSIAGAVSGAAAIPLSFGGSGAIGGMGGIVAVNSQSQITTKGTNAHGILAQSVGGGGGSGGYSVSGSISGGASAGAAFGGTAGGGGSGSNVTVNSSGTIDTSGEHSYGILAQSVGGGGGDGGFGVAAGISGGPVISFAMGGSGGAGGMGGSVVVNSSSSITTSNGSSHGIFAQSLGGGGGSGGFSVAGGLSSGVSISASVGGSGGSGGSARDVALTSTGTTIRTDGNHSYGLLAQSVGGGGGDGGFSVAGGISSAPSLNFSMGGDGGVAGAGAAVIVTNSTAIDTHGEDSHGIFAQSVGGGGGSGGFSVAGGISFSGLAISASLGGKGEGGGSASNVTVNSSGKITTSGDHAYGILAQSVGGGGGDGGFSVAGAISQGPAITFSMGGSGAQGGRGATVNVNNSGDITTGGELAYGIFAQSLGGGGGSGGFSVAGSLSTQSGGLAIGIGGAGGIGVDAGLVTVANSGSIETTNKGSHAIMAQSVGGGGGAGGFGGALVGGFGNGANLSVGVGGAGGMGGNASNVVVRSTGSNIMTRGVASYGIFAQSVGGGGGDGGAGLAASLGSQSKSVNLALGIGRSGGSGGIGGNVAVNSSSAIQTEGIVAHGIVAQSIGGGGGNGGFSVAGSLSTSTNAKQLSISVGGSGGGGGRAGNVGVTNTGQITTLSSVAGVIPNYGTNLVATNKADIPMGSVGILAQSIGGGGGNGGSAYSGTFAGTGAKNISVSIGGGGGDGNAAGNVTVQNSGLIETWGDNSHGIMAQSIGGGGGNGGSANALAADVSGQTESWNVNIAGSVGGGGGDGGIGGNVYVVNNSNIITHGKSAHGILAQSIGGGGGNGGASVAVTGGFDYNTNVFNASGAIGGGGGEGNHGGNVDVVNHGSIETYEDASYGIFAQSVGGGGGVGGSARALSVTVELNQLLINPFTDWKKYFSGFSQTLNLSVGGDGGGASDGGIVSVTNVGNIKTRGADAYGIFAQSIGGGGGIGGAALNGIPLDLLTNVPSPVPADKVAEVLLEGTALRSFGATQIVLGGDGGSSGNGDNSIVNNTGTIETLGDGAHGILAQSIGGGGGLGGMGAIGLVGKVGIGGAGGTAGNGGTVTVIQSGDVTTSGVTANGITAQSVGGGGGMGGSVERGIANFGVGGAIGQGGGNAGNGGTVVVASGGNITTSNKASYGIFAQSVGGGGGVAGGIGVGLGFAGSTGGHGDGGQVTVAHTGDITTYGHAADGIFAQSAGGADIVTFSVGDLLDPATFVLALKYQSNAVSAYVLGRLSFNAFQEVISYPNSGPVSGSLQTNLVNELNAITHGVNIYDPTRFAGVALRPETTLLKNQNPSGDDLVRLNRWLLEDAFPHELSGDFGAGIALGVGGNVDITVTGDITAHGTNANGIFAQSTGANGAGDITINILGSGTVHGGSGDSAGVRIEGGANNTLTNYGTITTLNGDPGVAFLGGTGNDRVENFGTLIGQVLLGDGMNSWSNHLGSSFSVQTSFALGAGNTFDNRGTLRGSGQIIGNVVNGGDITPGNSAGSLTIDGDLNLLGSANMTFEIGGLQQGTSYDFVHVTNFVQFAGTLSLSLIDSFLPLGTDLFTLMEFASGSGLFDNVLNGGRLLTLDSLGSFQVNYTPTSLQVGNFQPLDVGLHATIQRNASGHIVIQFPGVSGNHYAVEYTSSLASNAWTAVPSPVFTFPATGVGQWIDDGTQTGGLGGSRFYQVKLLGSQSANTPLVIWISRNTSSQPVLSFAGSPGDGKIVEYSTNLNTGVWTPVTLAVFTFPLPGLCRWVDDGSLTVGLSGQARFYRVRQ